MADIAMPAKQNIAIAGAGLAGLSTALSLHKLGHIPQIFEQRAELTEAGAGIQISPNAAHCLKAHGLLDKALDVAVEPDALVVFDGLKGHEITRCQLGARMRDKYGAPNLVLHRADLQKLFVDAVNERGIALHLGKGVTSATELQGKISITTGSEHEADGLVIADGFWSKLRYLIDAKEPQNSGHTAFRIVAKRSDLPAPYNQNITGLWLAPKAHVVHYPVQGGDTINFVVVFEGGEHSNGWERTPNTELFAQGAARLAPILRETLQALSGWSAWSLGFVRLNQFAKGRMVLVGDAAHATLPYMAQGGAMAIGDGLLLANALKNAQDIITGFEAFDKERRDRAHEIQDLSFQNASVFHLSGLLASGRNAVLRMSGKRLTDRYAWLYGWKPPVL